MSDEPASQRLQRTLNEQHRVKQALAKAAQPAIGIDRTRAALAAGMQPDVQARLQDSPFHTTTDALRAQMSQLSRFVAVSDPFRNVGDVARSMAAGSQSGQRLQTQVRTAADIGALVRTARKAMKMNQAQFAAHAGVGRRFVSELESGKASLEFDRVMACAEAAGVDLVARIRGG
jgi:y4mF family transcriptional regulator